MHGWVAERMVRCAEKMVGNDLPPKYGRSGSPHNTSNNTCAPSQLPYMVWLVGWLGGRPIRPGFGIGVAISQVKKPLGVTSFSSAGCERRGCERAQSGFSSSIGRFYFMLRVHFSVFVFVVRLGRRGPLRFMLVCQPVPASSTLATRGRFQARRQDGAARSLPRGAPTRGR